MRRARILQVMAAAGMLGMVGAESAAAQVVQPWTERAFVNVNGGAQSTARRYDVTGSFPLYQETATYETSLTTGDGPLFDIAGGYRVFGNLAVGLGVTRYADSHDATVTGLVPDPLFFDTPHSSSLPLGGLKHSETAVHLSAAFMVPLRLPVLERLDVVVFGGPSFISLDKDVLDAVSVAPGTTNLTTATTSSVSGRGTGGHVGLDVSYIAFRTAGVGLGIGVFVRQSGATVDVPEVSGGAVKVGGLNYGAGARIRF
jgi:hypothetical protein